MTIPVWIKTTGMKLPFSTYATNIVVLKICVIDWQSYPSLCDTLFFSVFDDTSLWILPEAHDPSLYDTSNEILTIKKKCSKNNTVSSWNGVIYYNLFSTNQTENLHVQNKNFLSLSKSY